MKRITAIILSLSIILSLAACSGKPEDVQTTASEESVTFEESVSDTPSENNGEQALSPSAPDGSSAAEITLPSSEPTEWTTEEIVEFYKAAAIKSKTKVKSKEMKELEEMVVNNGDGVLGTLVEWVTPFLIKALEDSEVEFDGITGGYESLIATDVTSAKAYKSGDYTVIEMTMKEQTDGIHADRYSGTVGHAISVVGDISSVAEALSFLVIDFENADIKLRYVNPTLKVKINKDGIIEKGTWSYNINITVANLYVAAARLPIEAMVESAHGKVSYVITVGGGF